MLTHPYRTPAPRPGAPEPPAGPPAEGDGELVPVYTIVWIASVMRVAQGLLRAETFGAELTLASIALVVLPLAAVEGVRGLLRARDRGGRRGG